MQFSLSLVVLKALPVLVLGGFDSILGAIVGGLIVGATEKLAEVYIGPFFGGGIEIWFAYVVALGLPAGAARRAVRPHARGEGLIDDSRFAPPRCSRRLRSALVVGLWRSRRSSARTICSRRSCCRSWRCRSPASGSTC